MATQNQSQVPQSKPIDPPADSQLPIRTTSDWEKPMIDIFDLCLEVTAYIYHWEP